MIQMVMVGELEAVKVKIGELVAAWEDPALDVETLRAGMMSGLGDDSTRDGRGAVGPPH